MGIPFALRHPGSSRFGQPQSLILNEIPRVLATIPGRKTKRHGSNHGAEGRERKGKVTSLGYLARAEQVVALQETGVALRRLRHDLLGPG